ncbi:MAG: hypothetical protein KO464_01100 [Candidatus Methanofastidiosum sp.]|nr:hypothetical protein [Methanofastidiosum sp.]
MGDSSSIKNASDILSLLIMQSNGQIINETRTRAVLNDNAVLNNQSVNPGQNALNFYCDFYQPTSQFYGWSRAFGNDLDAFAQNRLAMFIGYFKDREMISQKNPNLRFGVSEMPNIANSPIVNFGRF